MKKINMYFFIIFLGFFSFKVYGEISISVRYFEAISAVAPKTEPILSCEILATLDGEPIELNLDNTIIIQSDVAFVKKIDIELPDVDGWQKVIWGLEIGSPHFVTFEIIISHNDEVGYRNLPELANFPGYDIDIFRGYVTKDRIIPPIDLTSTLPIQLNPTIYNYQFYFMFFGEYDPSMLFTPAPYLDSITFTNPNMSYIWTGLLPDKGGRPPKKILLGNYYMITLIYEEPIDKPYIHDWMILHFSGDIQYRIEITKNPYKLDYEQLMKLENPIGGEKVAPCDEMLIKWSGHNPEFPVNLQFSYDNKQNWQTIADVSGKDTSYIWKIPNNISENCYIRVSQSFVRKSNKPLVYDSAEIISAEFNGLSTKALTISNIGNVVEWDLFGTPTDATILTTLSFPDNEGISSAIYLTDNRFLILDNKNKKIYYVNTGTNSIDKEISLATVQNSALGRLLKDTKDRFILIEPQKHYGKEITFIDTAGNYITSIKENIPITNVVISAENDKLYYSLLDNSIKSIDLSAFPNFINSDDYNFAKLYNIIGTMAISKDDNKIAVGTRTLETTGIMPYYGINIAYDKQTNKIFNQTKINNVEAVSVDFNPTGNLLIVGSPINPQIRINDLTGGTNSANIQQIFDTLLGLKVSKSGNSLLAYSKGNVNCVYISFALPERAENAIPFSIVQPSVVLADESLSKMRDLLIGTRDSVTFNLQLCNNGEVKVMIDTGYFFNINPHFRVDYSKTFFPLEINIGECVDFSVISLPSDTGILTNTLRFVSCGYNYDFPFSNKGINRKLTNLVDTIDFGEICLLEKNTLKLELFRNDDSIDVIINEIRSTDPNFKIAYFARDTILHPGEKYYAEVYYNPQNQNAHIGTFNIIYCGQWNVIKKIHCKGRGIGTFLELSHYYLPFIPEIQERKIVVTNTGDATLYIDSVDFNPIGYYTCLTELPINVSAGDSVELVIKCNNSDSIMFADMRVMAVPCASSQEVKLVPYSGTATLTIPLVETDAKNTNCYIPIMLEQTENYSYSGERFLDFEISINPSLFISRYGTSNYGKVEIKSDNVISGKRIIGIRFTGDITQNQTELLRLYGVAALGNTDTSIIKFISDGIYFGNNIEIKTQDGLFKLLEICEDRFLINSGTNDMPGCVKIEEAITPNPAKEFINVEFEVVCNLKNELHIEIYDLAGSLILTEKLLGPFNIGKHRIEFDVSDYPNGTYQARIVCGGNIIDVLSFIVIN